jgi:hypothetical protein
MLQKRVVCLMTDMVIGPHVGIFLDSWKFYLWYLNTFSWLIFVLKNRNLFITNYDMNNVQTRYRDNLYFLSSSLSLYKKSVYYTGINIFNKLPSELKELVQTPKIFKSSLKRYVVLHSFYNSEEFYCMNVTVSYLVVFLFLCLWLCYVLLYITFLPWLVPMITGTLVFICDSFYIQWLYNFTNLYLDQLEFDINWNWN